MIKNKALKFIPVLIVLSLLLVACTSANESKEAVSNPMQYVTAEALKDSIVSESNEYIILDVRKAEDYSTSHIVGSYGADQDAANKEGDDATGIANLKKALKEATGSEVGNPGEKYALVCYSGKSYAQKATDLMIQMGISAEQIYTLEGGMKAWTEAGDDYKDLLE
ncbi:rhodanese domain-containing protein [Proteiniborus sp. DW1]|uniref:rhodanese-like domain-containing protein n=1 Tax=Proteiniborus sp. DW1 TaxID=1889883 RepID=UPI00092DEF80|nr:rhodanese-like domain-containing protein [Proteiniborus sp. DW1]SCG82237.1 rhodanese domain-containing protein [Proteiniborus sp. DW1]